MTNSSLLFSLPTLTELLPDTQLQYGSVETGTHGSITAPGGSTDVCDSKNQNHEELIIIYIVKF